MKTKHGLTAALCGSLAISGCAQSASSVSASYIPTGMYSSQSCTALRQEKAQVIYTVNTLTGKQNAKAGTDALAVGVGLVLFWPALFLLAKDAGNTQQLADAKGRYDAIERAGKSKGCW